MIPDLKPPKKKKKISFQATKFKVLVVQLDVFTITVLEQLSLWTDLRINSAASKQRKEQ